jgi:hypothetical protein
MGSMSVCLIASVCGHLRESQSNGPFVVGLKFALACS